MKIVRRKKVFETNSSSCHSIAIYGKPDYCVNFSTDSYGNITVELGEYGWNGDPLDDFYSKLAYAISIVLHTEYPGFNNYDSDFYVDDDTLRECPGYQAIVDCICQVKDCEGILIKREDNDFYPYGYIDHQSYEDYKCFQDFLDDYGIDLYRFLFDYNIGVNIDNDNH